MEMINRAVVHCGLLAAAGALSFDAVRPRTHTLRIQCWGHSDSSSSARSRRGRDAEHRECVLSLVIPAAGVTQSHFDWIRLPALRVLETLDKSQVFSDPILPFRLTLTPLTLRLIN